MPIPSYFYQGTRALPEFVRARLGEPADGRVQLATNLYYLGHAGIVDAEGLRVAFLGGQGTDARGDGAPLPQFGDLDTPEKSAQALQALLADPALALGTAPPPPNSEAESLQEARAHLAAMSQYAERLAEDAERLAHRKPIDFLFCNAWPKGIEQLSKNALPDGHAPSWGLRSIARLAEAARPRYLFSAAPRPAEAESRSLPLDAETLECGVFWEREPYENPPFAALPAPEIPPLTRFLSLARLANARKARWFMALQVVPGDELSATHMPSATVRPSNLTPCPFFEAAPKRSAQGMDAVRFDGAPATSQKRRKKGRQAKEVMPVGPENCWFCLSNPRLEKHLVVTVGEECYMALPKGQVPVSSDESALVPGGGHVLLVPIAHVPTPYATEASGAALRAETGAYLQALAACYASYGAVPVAWEVVRRSNTRAGHTQMQVVPVAQAQLDGAEAFFREAAEAEGLAFEEDNVAAAFDDLSSPLLTAQDREDYCWIDLNGKRLLLLLRGERFNLQFPRETLTTYLGMPERAEWKSCARPEEVEAAECDEFKEAFAEFGAGIGE